MRRTSICLGVILALVLLYSNPTFAQHGPSGAEGMPSSGEMRAVTNAGGKWEALPNAGGMQAKFTNKDGSSTYLSNTQVRNIVQTSYNTPTAPIAPGSTDFGLGRGHSDAMGRAVTAFKMQTGNYAPPVSSTPTFTPVSKAQAFPPGWSVTNPNQAGIQSLVDASKSNSIKYSGSTIPGGTTTVIKTNTGTTGINAPLNSGNGVWQTAATYRYPSDTAIAYSYNKPQPQSVTTTQPTNGVTSFRRDGYPGFLPR